MADTMKDLLDQIETAVRGEDVRDSIVKAINNIQINKNANTLDGHASSYFAKQSDMSNILPLATKVENENPKPITSGAVYTYVETTIGGWLDTIIGEPSAEETLERRLHDVYTGKYQIISALNTAGISLPKLNPTLSEIADAINSKLDLSDGSIIGATVTNLEVTENGDYAAPTSTVYNHVSVNVPPKLSQLSVDSVDFSTLQKTYEPTASDNFEGYSKVTVDMSKRIKEFDIKHIAATGKATFKVSDANEDKQEKDYIYGYNRINVDISDQLVKKEIDSLDDLPDKPDEIVVSVAADNAKTNADEDDESKKDKIIGYKEVKVDVTPKLGPKEIEVDDTYGEEHTYIASEDSLYGYSQVIVRVKESEGPFTVTFYNGRTKLDTHTDVKKHQSCRYAGPKISDITPEGQVFTGWNPEPIDVTHNLDCYAEFVDEADNPVSVSSNGNISGTWDQIAIDGGASLPIGAWKVLRIRPCMYGATEVGLFRAYVVKVASGEQGTASSWLSLTPIPKSLKLYLNNSTTEVHFGDDDHFYENSDLRTFLNGEFLAAMASTDKKYGNTQSFINSIKKVSKCVNDLNPNKSTYSGKPVPENIYLEDKIWLPSIYELVWEKGANTQQYTGNGNYGSSEKEGVQYELPTKWNDVPEGVTITQGFALRSHGIYEKCVAGPRSKDSSGNDVQYYYKNGISSSSSYNSQSVASYGFAEDTVMTEKFALSEVMYNARTSNWGHSGYTMYSFRQSSITNFSGASGEDCLCFGFCT